MIAFILRIWDLSSRAIHHDESLHSFYSWMFTKYVDILHLEIFGSKIPYYFTFGNGYEHNPMLHGPLQFEFNAFIFTIFGSSDFTSRILYVIFGSLLVGLPYFFRFKLGNLGAIFTSLLLCLSPTMLYFSRFARNDILIAFWTFSIVILIWKYIEENKNHYLYMIAAFLALSFATKENTYILIVTILSSIAFISIPDFKTNIVRNMNIYSLSPPVAFYKLSMRTFYFIFGKFNLLLDKAPLNLLILIFLLTLPQWAALFAVLQDSVILNWTNLTLATNMELAQSEGLSVGIPIGGGVVIAVLIVTLLIILSMYFGYLWNWKIWWKSSAIFYGIWLLAYTKFFTDLSGIGSGVWQSLGYWVVQQEVARGGQPWYYYIYTMSIYEFFSIFFFIFSFFFYFKKMPAFVRFLLSWSLLTFIAYTIASEKMPWLMVHISLPLICMTGYFLGDNVSVLKSLFTNFKTIYKFNINKKLISIGTFTFLIIMTFSFSVFVGFKAAYIHSDEPLGPIIYTQTSSDISDLNDDILDWSIKSGDFEKLPILIDTTSGFTWPWQWYLREFENVYWTDFSNYNSDNSSYHKSLLSNREILVIHEKNLEIVTSMLSDNFEDPLKIRHRSWYPEVIYRNFEITNILKFEFWHKTYRYLFFNEGVADRIGSENSFVIISKNISELE